MLFGLCDKRVSSDVPALLCYHCQSISHFGGCPYTLPHGYIRSERTRGARPTTAIVNDRGVCHRYTNSEREKERGEGVGGWVGGLDGMGLIEEVPPPRGTSAYA